MIKLFFLNLSIFLIFINFYGTLRRKDKNISRLFYNFKNVEELVDKINQNIIHYKKPPPNSCPFYENYILFLFSFLPFTHFKDYEFYNIKRIANAGQGFCSQQSILLLLCLRKKNIRAKIVGFKGHVIVFAKINNKNFLLDPDYGVCTKCKIEDLKSNLKAVIDSYLKKKIEKKKIFLLKKIYSGTYEIIPNRIISRNVIVEELCYVLKWIIPFIIFYFLINN